MNPVKWMGALVLPLFSLLFMATIFGRGTMDQLPVGIVDHDATIASRQLARRVDASPSLSVRRHYVDEAEARAALQRKEIYGYLRIPYDYEARLGSGRKVTLVYAYHYALLSVGARVSAAFRTALAGEALPFVGLNFPQGNVNLNYVNYLAYPFFMVLLQVLCLVLTIYVCGQGERLLPYTLCFAAVSLLAHGVFYGWMGIPLEGSVWVRWLASVVFLCVMQGLGVVIHRLSPDQGTAMSAGSMIGSLGATLCGVTFPLIAMDAPVRWLSALFPIRWFMELL
jgi:hypothetical protein